MPQQTILERKARQSLRSAQICAVLFGLGLLAWAIAPAVVARIAQNKPEVALHSLRIMTLLLGIGYLLIGSLMKRENGWTLWTSLVASLVLLGLAIVVSMVSGTDTVALFPLLLALATAATSWLALDAQHLLKTYGHSHPATDES